MKIKKSWILTLIAVLVLIILALPKLNLFSEKSASSDRSGMSRAVPVEVQVLKTSPLDSKIQSTGSVLGEEEVTLRSEISGKITGIMFREGSRVRKGDLLIKINDSELQAQLKSAKYRQALADDQVKRQKRQLEIEAISQEEFDRTQNQAQVIQSEIDLIAAKISKTEIRAPFDGAIGLKYVSEGSYISPATDIATLVRKDKVKIDFSVPAKYADEAHVGDKIYFRKEGSDKRFEGEIYAIEPRIDPDTRTLHMRARYQNQNNEVLPGSFVEVELVLETIGNAILIPTQALIPELSGQKVFLVRSGKAAPQPVETGLRTDKNIEIKSGVQAGDTLITTGLMQIRPGVPVQISNPSE